MVKKCSNLVREYLSKIKGCGIYNRYPNISDRAAWDSLSDEVRTKLIKAGEEAGKEPWTQLFISDFLEFSKSGNRVRFEDKYFPRRRKLNKLVMAECVENKGRFLDDILDGLYLILEETTWCLPPHNSYERDAVQETLPDVTRQIIDLFQAESGAEVAFTEYLLRPVFEKISPYISIYVNERLKERIFEPYNNVHFWWMGDGVQTMCNWTPWIVQNVLLCALTRPKEVLGDGGCGPFLEKAAKSIDYFLDEYGEDGGCNEGAQYYSHAGLCLFGCLELIDGATDGSRSVFGGSSEKIKNDDNTCFHRIYQEKKIRNIANFIVKMYVGGGYYVNFADCSALPGKRTAREFLFGKAIGDEVLASFAAADFRTESDSQKLISEEINLFYHVMQAFAYDEMMAYPESKVLPEDSWYESMGLMVARDQIYTLAAKAGNNGDSHNHNDVGSFTIYKNGAPFVIDLGVGTYTKKTFSDRRYELWTMQSQFHNVPTFVDMEHMSAVQQSSQVQGNDLQSLQSQVNDVQSLHSRVNRRQLDGRQSLQSQEDNQQSLQALLESLGADPAQDAYNSAIIMQKDGTEYGASDVSCILCTNTGDECGNAVSSLKMDICGAYGENIDAQANKNANDPQVDTSENDSQANVSENDSQANTSEYAPRNSLDKYTGSGHISGIGSYIREVALHKGHGIIVHDTYCGQKPFMMSIMTYEKPELTDLEAIGSDRASLAHQASNITTYKTIKVGNIGKIRVSGPITSLRIQEYPITDDRLATAWKHSVYRILMGFEEGASDLKLEFI